MVLKSLFIKQKLFSQDKCFHIWTDWIKCILQLWIVTRIDLFYFRKKWSAVGHIMSSLWFPPVKNAQKSGRKDIAGLFSDYLIGLWTVKCHDTQKTPGREKCCVHEGFCVIDASHNAGSLPCFREGGDGETGEKWLAQCHIHCLGR